MIGKKKEVCIDTEFNSITLYRPMMTYQRSITDASSKTDIWNRTDINQASIQFFSSSSSPTTLDFSEYFLSIPFSHTCSPLYYTFLSFSCSNVCSHNIQTRNHHLNGSKIDDMWLLSVVIVIITITIIISVQQQSDTIDIGRERKRLRMKLGATKSSFPTIWFDSTLFRNEST